MLKINSKLFKINYLIKIDVNIKFAIRHKRNAVVHDGTWRSYERGTPF
jgi:hypothetical protein